MKSGLTAEPPGRGRRPTRKFNSVRQPAPGIGAKKNMVLEPMQCIAKEGRDAHPRNPFHLFLWFCPLTELTSNNSTNTGIQQIIWQNSIWVSVKEARQTHKAVRMSVKWRRLLLKMDSLAGAMYCYVLPCIAMYCYVLKMDSLAGGFCAVTLPLKSLASGFVLLAGH